MTTEDPATASSALRGLWGVGLLTLTAGLTVLTWLAQGGADGWNRVPLVVSRLAIDGGVVALWAMAAAGAGSALLRVAGLCWACRGGMGVMAVSLGWGALGLVTLLLGLAGWVGSGVAWGLVAAGLAAGAWAVRGKTMTLATPAGGSWPGWAAGGVLAGTAAFLSLFPAGVLWPTEPNGYDVLAYHLQLPREWFELGRIAVLPHNVFSYMPLGMEMHYLTAMGLLGDPWGAMYAAQLMHVAVWVAAGVAAYGLGTAVARVLNAAGGGAETAKGWLSMAGWASAGVVVGSPLAVMLAPIAYNEGAVVLYGVLALRAVVELLGDGAEGEDAGVSAGGGRWAVLAGVFGGLAAGAKLTAVPLWLAALPLGVLCVVRPFSRGLRMGALVLAAGLAVSSPWWVRTAVSAGGNPVFPVAAGKLGAPAGWDATRVERFERAHRPREDQRSVAGRLEALWRQVVAAPEFGWVLLPGTVVLGGVGVAWVALAGRCHRGGRAVVGLSWGLLTFHAAVWLGLTHLQGRFWTAALPVMALLWAAGMSVAVGPGRGWAVRRWLAASGVGVVMVSVGVAVGVVYARLEPFRAADGRLVTEVVGVEFPVVERLMVAEETLSVPTNEMLTLVGDARAYAYRRPMSALRYTSVFDVTGSTAAEGWRVGSDDWVLVHPGELSRLSRTYRGLPPVPSAWQTLPGPTLLPPGDPRRGR